MALWESRVNMGRHIIQSREGYVNDSVLVACALRPVSTFAGQTSASGPHTETLNSIYCGC
jgi:hypothetical protein